MQIKQYFFFLFLIFGFSSPTYAQKPIEEKLDLLLAQGHYKLVYRKAKRLAQNPAYDHSKTPEKYRQLAAQELSKNVFWAKRHELEVEWMSNPPTNINQGEVAGQKNGQTQQLIQEAKKYIGVPYKEAGMDPSGFDCSGFTCYIFEANGVELPRRAADQFNYCKQIGSSEARAGDLVFFTNGNQVNHVGILISEKGAPKQMIHASSSIGISIVEIDSSAYWKPKIIGYGRIK